MKRIVVDPDAPADAPERRFVYRADVSDGRSGTFRARLLQASSGARGAAGRYDELTVAPASGSDVVPFLAGVAIGLVGVVAVVVSRRWQAS